MERGLLERKGTRRESTGWGKGERREKMSKNKFCLKIPNGVPNLVDSQWEALPFLRS